MAKVASNKSDIVGSIPMACADEDAAVEFMEEMRWGSEPSCPRCGDVDVYKMTKRGSDERNERYLWRCRGCGRQYTVRIGTVMEDSPIPLRHWCFAFWQACVNKKGVSALQIKRQTGLTYKSALYMMHRIREAMNGAANSGPLSGDIEADETYVGGKPRKLSKQAKEAGARRRRGFSKEAREKKSPVMAIVQRDGQARAHVPTDVTAETLGKHLRDAADPRSRLHTDEAPAYITPGREFEGGHETVNHSESEYARDDVTTNTVEAFFAILKRGVYGVFHNVSKKHLHRYVSEFEFRWNTRQMDDGERVRAAIQGADGKRLMYRVPTGA